MNRAIGCCRLTAGKSIEQPFGALAANNGIGDLIGVSFVAISGGTEAARQRDPTALLDDVSSFVRSSPQIRPNGERDVFTVSVGARPENGAGPACRGPPVGSDTGDIMPTERPLNRGVVGNRLTTAADPTLRFFVVALAGRTICVQLNTRRGARRLLLLESSGDRRRHALLAR